MSIKMDEISAGPNKEPVTGKERTLRYLKVPVVRGVGDEAKIFRKRASQPRSNGDGRT